MSFVVGVEDPKLRAALEASRQAEKSAAKIGALAMEMINGDADIFSITQSNLKDRKEISTMSGRLSSFHRPTLYDIMNERDVKRAMDDFDSNKESYDNDYNSGHGGNEAAGGDEGGGRGALMAMIAARGPRLPPPPGGDAGDEGGGRSALMSMIAARGPRLPPPPGVGGADSGGDTEGRGALMSMIAARGPRLPPPPGAAGGGGGDGGPRPRLALPPRGKTPEQLAAEAAAKAAEEAENAKYPPKPAYTPSMKMRGLFWTRMKGSEAADTIWTKVPEARLQADELERLFGDEKSGKTAMAKRRGSTTGGPEDGDMDPDAEADAKPSKNVSLFDSKRTQNVCIAVRKLRMTPKEIADEALKLDEKIMTKAAIDCMLLVAPTDEEITAVSNFPGGATDLDLTGRVFFELKRIPRLVLRLEIMKTSLEWLNGFEQLADEVNTLDAAVDELRLKETEQPLIRVLSQVLYVGNYMNSGTGRAQAHGVRLDVLVKLANMKQNNDSKLTLLHYIAKKTMNEDSKDGEFYSNWVHLWNAPKISVRQVDSDLKALAADLNIMRTERTRCTSGTDKDSPMFTTLVAKINAFLSEAEPKLASLQTRVTAVSSKIQKARAYYGHVSDPSSGECQNAAFFSILATFAAMYVKCKEDILSVKLEAEKKAKAEAEKQEKAARRFSVKPEDLENKKLSAIPADRKPAVKDADRQAHSKDGAVTPPSSGSGTSDGSFRRPSLKSTGFKLFESVESDAAGSGDGNGASGAEASPASGDLSARAFNRSGRKADPFGV
jgi:hypothetical protein